MNQDTATATIFVGGLALIVLGVVVDHTSLVLAGCAFWWLAKEIGNA